MIMSDRPMTGSPWPHTCIVLCALICLPLGVAFDLQAIERTRSGSFEIDTFTIKAAAVAWALELALVFLPVRRTAQMGALGKDDVDPPGISHHPDPLGLLEFSIHSISVVFRVSDPKLQFRFEQGARKEETNRRQ